MASIRPDPQVIRVLPDRNDRTYAYLENGWMSIEVKNTLETDIVLDQLTCIFEEGNRQYLDLSNISIAGLDPKTLHEILPSEPFPADFGVQIRRGETSPPLQVKFTVKTSFMLSSNRCRIGMRYRCLDASHVSDPIEVDPSKGSETFVIVRNISRRNLTIFLSHKIPEDTIFALRMQEILVRLGFDGYLAEERVRTGIEDYWADELYPEIDQSRALIACWTENVRECPQSIEDEIQHARKKGRRIYPVIVKGLESKRFYQLFPKKSYHHLSLDLKTPLRRIIQLALTIQQDMQEGKI